MTIHGEVIKFVRSSYPAAFREVASIGHAPATDLVMVDMMLEIYEFYPRVLPMTWAHALERMTHTVTRLLKWDGVRQVVAVFDCATPMNVAKLPVQMRRDTGRATATTAAAGAGAGAADVEPPALSMDTPALTDCIPADWTAHLRSRAWRTRVLLPRVAHYLTFEDRPPPGKVLVVDADFDPVAVTADGAFRVAESVTAQLAPCTEADFRMFSWCALDAYAHLSASIYSVDGDELAALLLFYPTWIKRGASTTDDSERRLQWIRKRRDTGHEGHYDICSIAELDAGIRAEFLLAQLVLQHNHAHDPGAEITDYRAVFVALMCMRGCDYVEAHKDLTFQTLYTAYLSQVRQSANFLFFAIDEATDQRQLAFDYQLYRFLIHSAYGLRYGYAPLRKPLEQIRQNGEHASIATEDIFRQRAARLKWCLHYFANAWNPAAYPLPDPLAQTPDPADASKYCSIYGMQLVDPKQAPSATNVQLASHILV